MPKIRKRTGIRTWLGVIVAVLMLWGVYATLPIVRHDTADYLCMQTLPDNGSFSTRWVPFPLAHWECTSKDGRAPEKKFDLGWWPTLG